MARTSVRGIYERVKGSGVWWIRWTDSGGHKRREKIGRYSDATVLLAKRKTEKLQQIKLPENFRKKPLPLSTLISDAIAYSTASNGGRSTHELKLKFALIESTFGTRQAISITKSEIVAWLQSEAEKRNWKPGTVNRYQAAFSLIFRVAIDNEKLTVNSAARIRRKREDNGRIRFLSIKEEQRLRKTLQDHYSFYLPAFLISIHSGMRASEQWSTEWEDVDFKTEVLTIRQTKNGPNGPTRRHVPMNAIMVRCFQQLLSRRTTEKFVFLNSNGKQLRGHRDWFGEALNRSRIAGYHWHDNRHTFCSRLVMAGVDIRTVAALAGHATIQMTMRYAHLSPDHNRAAVDKLMQYSLK